MKLVDLSLIPRAQFYCLSDKRYLKFRILNAENFKIYLITKNTKNLEEFIINLNLTMLKQLFLTVLQF